MTRFMSVAEWEALTGGDALSSAERNLIAACRAGRACQLESKRPVASTLATRIRADLVALLITGATPACGLHPSGIWLEGAWIEGPIDLRFAKAKGQTALRICHFAHKPILGDARLFQLSLDGSRLPGLFAQGAKVDGNISLRGVASTGTVDIVGATIGGQFDAEAAILDGRTGSERWGHALDAQGVEVRGSFLLRHVKATGTVNLSGAFIGGQIACDCACFDGRTGEGKWGHSLNGQGVKVGQDIFLTGVAATGLVQLSGASIGRQVSCIGAAFDGRTAPETWGHALLAQRANIGGSLFLKAITAYGTIGINGATVGGQVACDGAIFDGRTGPSNWNLALDAGGVKVGDSFFLTECTATGPVAVNNAEIGHQFDCEGAALNGRIDATSIGPALNAQGLEVGESLFLTSIDALGMVDVNGATVGGQFACDGAAFDGGSGRAILAQRLIVNEAFFLRNVKSVHGLIDLTSAHAFSLTDDESSWPKNVILDGFTYDYIHGPTDITFRLAWLAKGNHAGGEFHPQPYTQLAKALREMGHESGAREVLAERERKVWQYHIARNKERYREIKADPDQRGDLGVQCLRIWRAVLWNVFLRVVVGYGYKPERALWWSLGAIGISILVYFLAWQVGVMVPNSAVILTSQDWTTAMAANPNAPAHAWQTLGSATHYETFSALAYAADAFIPFVDLGQHTAWAATTANWFGTFVWAYTWLLILFGWVVTALGAAAITGIIRRE